MNEFESSMRESASDGLECSIIVCTYNRADSLAVTLRALAAQRVPAHVGWEVVVVDNNSRDRTAEVVGEAARAFPGSLRYCHEPRQGLSHARNRGIGEARGRVLMFTDDDVCPESDWVAQLLEGMRAHGADAVGGYIAPNWEASPPAWLTERFHGFLAIRVDESGPRPIVQREDLPFGANMAFRREVFDRVGPFDVRRGRKGNVLSSGEDWELFERVLAAGLRVVYLPRARVSHRVEAERVRRGYFRRWRFQSSRNIAQSRGVPGQRRILGVPPYLLPQLLRASARALWARLGAAPDEAFFREILVWHFLGTISGCYASRDVIPPSGEPRTRSP